MRAKTRRDIGTVSCRAKFNKVISCKLNEVAISLHRQVQIRARDCSKLQDDTQGHCFLLQ